MIASLTSFIKVLAVIGILVIAGRFILGIPGCYNVRGTITDTDGNPLNDIYLDMKYEVWGTTLPVIHSRRKVDSVFHINGGETHFLELKFVKKAIILKKVLSK